MAYSPSQKSFLYMKVSKFFWLILLCGITFLTSCSKEKDESGSAEKYIFNAKFFHIELPNNLSVELDSNFEYYVYRVKDSLGNQVMSFYGGMDTQHSYDFFWKKSDIYEFQEIARIDTAGALNDNIVQKRIVVLFFIIQHSSHKESRHPEFVEFSYYPGIMDSSISESIIRSARIHSYNKEYLCNAFLADADMSDGETIAKLRNRPLRDLLTLVRMAELDSVAKNKLFEKGGKYQFLADCYMDDVYKGSFYIDGSCNFEWNGKLADKKDVTELLNSMNDGKARKLVQKCNL